MKVLVTGGAGFIGSHYVDTFLARGDDVAVFDTCSPPHEQAARYIQGDIGDASAVDAAVKGNDLVIHAAGVLGTHETVLSSCETVEANISGSLNVLNSIARYGNKLVHISKPNVWLNPYSITKDCVEKFCFMYVNEFSADIVVLKLYNVYGTRQKYAKVRKAIPTWIVDALNDKPIDVFGSGAATIDLIHTRDVCEGTAAIVDRFDACKLQPDAAIAEDVYGRFPAYNDQILELGSGGEITVLETVDMLRRLLDVPASIRHLPMRRGEIDRTRLRADLKRMESLTGFTPRMSLTQGLLETIAYYRANLARINNGEL